VHVALATGARIAGVKVRTLASKKSIPRAPTSSCRITSPISIRLSHCADSAPHFGDGEKRIVQGPILGHNHDARSLVPVDRGNRDAGISAVRDAVRPSNKD